MIIIYAFELWVFLAVLNLLYEALKRRDWHKAHERILHQGFALSAFIMVLIARKMHCIYL